MATRYKKYIIRLSADEREMLSKLARSGKAAARKITRARVLLKADAGEYGPGWTDERIAEAYGCTTRSLESWRKQAVEDGPLSLLERRPRSLPTRRKLDGDGEARLTVLAWSKPPQGAARWTLNLLADRLVELQVVDSISYETVRRVLKKTSPSRGGR